MFWTLYLVKIDSVVFITNYDSPRSPIPQKREGEKMSVLTKLIVFVN